MLWSVFAIYSKSNIQNFFLFLHIPLAIHRNFRNWHRIFYNRSGSYKIHALPIYIFLVYGFQGNIDYLKKHIFFQTRNKLFQTQFPKTDVISTSIRVREGWSNADWKSLVWSRKKLYWATLKLDKLQKSGKKCHDLCWKVHDSKQSFVLRSYIICINHKTETYQLS